MGIKMRKEKNKETLMMEDVKADNIDDLKKEIKNKFDHLSMVVATKEDLRSVMEKETKRICAKYDNVTLGMDNDLKGSIFNLDEITKRTITEIKESF